MPRVVEVLSLSRGGVLEWVTEVRHQNDEFLGGNWGTRIKGLNVKADGVCSKLQLKTRGPAAGGTEQAVIML